MKNIVFGIVLSSLVAVTAAETKKIAKSFSPELLEQVQMEKFGGFVNDTRAQRGKVVVVNAQKAADAAWIESVRAAFAEETLLSIGIEPGAFDLSKPQLKGDATLFVIDDPKLPMSLVAPESKWVMVNVAPLKTDKVAFFKARVGKLVTRGLAYLLGAADSGYPMCLTGCVTKPADLDKFVSTQLPVDVLARFKRYSQGYGLRPYKVTTYKAACREGWAPAPTNQWQKAIFDEVKDPTKRFDKDFPAKKK